MTKISSKDGWTRGKLGDYFQIKHGYAFKGEFFAAKGPYIVLTPGNFYEEGGFRLKGNKEKYYIGDFPSGFVLKRGDLIVAMTEQAEGLLGSPALIPKNDRYLHNQRLGLIIFLNTKRLDKRFLYYLFNFRSVREQIRSTANGAKIRHTSPSRIYEVKVDLPPLSGQRKIAAILSSYDHLIENNQRRIAILEEMARLIYGEWFVKFRFPGHKKVKMVGSALGPIPEGWELVHVEDAVRRVPSGQKYEQKTVAPSGMVPVLDQGKSGIIGYHNDEPGVLASEENPVIVFANHTCYQRIVHFPFSAIQNVLPFLPSIERQRNIYWLHWATKDLVRFNDYKGHWPEFMSKTLVLPPATVCSEFGALAKPLSLQIFVLEKIVSNLRFTRDLLLPKLISGEIDVESLDIKMPAENGAATAATV